MSYYTKKPSTASVGVMSTIKEMAWLLFVVFIIRTFGFGLYQVPTGSMETTMLVGERFFADKFTPLFIKPARGDIIALNDPVFEYSTNPVIRMYQEYVGWPIWPWGPSNWTKRVIGIPGDHVKGVIEDGKPVVYLNGKKADEPYLNKLPLLAVLDADPAHTADVKIDWRSFDPAVAYDKQLYYRVNPERIVHLEDLAPWIRPYLSHGSKITENGMLLKEPATPIEKDHEAPVVRSGENYWTESDEFDVHLGPDQYWLMGDNRRGSKDSRFFGPVQGRLIHGKILFRIWSIDSNESWWGIDLIKHPVDFWKKMRWSRFFERVK